MIYIFMTFITHRQMTNLLFASSVEELIMMQWLHLKKKKSINYVMSYDFIIPASSIIINPITLPDLTPKSAQTVLEPTRLLNSK